MAPALLVLSAIDPPRRRNDPGLIICVSVQAFSEVDCANLAFAFCEMREQTGSANKTKRLLPRP
jgi:hypothetical protein